MTIKAYRSTRYNADRMPKQGKRPPNRREGSFWGVSWQTEDTEDSGWDAMPGRHLQARR